MEQITLETIHRDMQVLREEMHEMRDALFSDQLTDDDLEFRHGVREAWREVDAGKVVARSVPEFLKELESW